MSENENVEIVLALSGPLDIPINFIKCLCNAKVTLTTANASLIAIANGQHPKVMVAKEDLEPLKNALKKLNVTIE